MLTDCREDRLANCARKKKSAAEVYLTLACLAASWAFRGDGVDLTIDDVKILGVTEVHLGLLGIDSLCIRRNSKLLILLVGSGVFAACVLAATVGGVGCNPGVSGGVIQRDGEGESIVAVEDLLQTGNDGDERIVELGGLLFAQVLLAREVLVDVLNNCNSRLADQV